MNKWIILALGLLLLSGCVLVVVPNVLSASYQASNAAQQQSAVYLTPVPGDTLVLVVTQQAQQIAVLATQNADSTGKLLTFGQSALFADTTSDISHDSRDAAWPIALAVIGVAVIIVKLKSSGGSK